MGRISPCLWFDKNAMEAAQFYTALFPNSKIECVTHYVEGGGLPAGTVLTVRFTLDGFEFNALNGGPYFTINPSISFMINCDSEEEVDEFWAKLSDGGEALMGLGEYPFNKKFGWLSDKFGVSWQIALSPNKQKITPCLMFANDMYGKAKEAIDLYCSVFGNGNISKIVYDESGTNKTVQAATFTIDDQEFMIMDSDQKHEFTFNEGVSLYVDCIDQAAIDDVWEKLTADGGEESQCGWLRDKFGVSWQIVNEDFERLMVEGEPKKVQQVMEEMFKMKKLIIQDLIDAYNR